MVSHKKSVSVFGILAIVFLGYIIYGLILCILYLVILIIKSSASCSKPRNKRPDVLTSEEYGKHKFLMLKDSRLKLHYVVDGPEEKPLMLFVHGFPECWYTWRHQLREFKKEYRVCALDTRGYGESDKPSAVSDYHVDELTDDLKHLIHQLGYTACVLVAHDWGGLIGWMFVMKYPELVDQVILCNCPHPMQLTVFMYMCQIPGLSEACLTAGDNFIMEQAFCGSYMGAKKDSHTKEDIEAYKYNFIKNSDWTGPCNYYRALMRYKYPEWVQTKKSPKIKVSMLMIWGDNDRALPNSMPEDARRYVEDYSLKFVKGASHWVVEEEPQIVNQLIWDFLKGEQDIRLYVGLQKT